MSYVIESLKLEFNQTIAIRVLATNKLGQRQYSQVVESIRVRTVPTIMQPVNRGDQTTETQVEVNWLALSSEAEIGNSPILSYQLVWDKATGTANIVASSTMQLTKLLIGLTPGQDYKFKVCARNIYGCGPYSQTVTIRASSIPDTMNIVESVSVL